MKWVKINPEKLPESQVLSVNKNGIIRLGFLKKLDKKIVLDDGIFYLKNPIAFVETKNLIDIKKLIEELKLNENE